MGRLRTVLIYTAGALASGIAIGYISYPDSLFVCLSAMSAAHIMSGMFRMCDRLLDPPPAIFLIFTRQERLQAVPAHALTSPPCPINNCTPLQRELVDKEKNGIMKSSMEYQTALGLAIVTRREKLGYSRAKLARIMGVDEDYVAFLEAGKYDLKLSEMIVIAGALRIPISNILAVTETELTDI